MTKLPAALGAIAAAALGACTPRSTEANLDRARSIAATAEATATACARELDALALASPRATWSALALHPLALQINSADQERLVFEDRQEISRRLRSVRGLKEAAVRLADDPRMPRSLPEIGDLTQQARAISARLCSTRDLAAAIAAKETRPAEGSSQRVASSVP